MLRSDDSMSRLQPQLRAMLDLAYDRSDKARLELAGQLASVYTDYRNAMSLREHELVNELIDQLMLADHSAPLIRSLLVEKFADKVSMPRKIAYSVATGSIDIAGDVLRQCQNLTDEDLITLVASQSLDHAAAIAEREKINEAVADALVTTGDLRVMQIVAENLGAKLSKTAVSALTKSARFVAMLREPVMKRPEMSAEAASSLYWWVSQDLRRFALKRFNLKSGQIDKSLAKTIEELLSYHELDKAKDDIMQQIAGWLEERDAISVRILPTVLRLGHFRLFNILLSRLAKMDLELIDIIVSEAGGRGLAVICRGLGVEKASFVSLFLLSRGAREGEHVVNPRELSYVLAAFDRLSVNLAHDLLRGWARNPEYLLNRQEDNLLLEA